MIRGHMIYADKCRCGSHDANTAIDDLSSYVTGLSARGCSVRQRFSVPSPDLSSTYKGRYIGAPHNSLSMGSTRAKSAIALRYPTSRKYIDIPILAGSTLENTADHTEIEVS
jgi:hypothetical protein